MALLSTPGSWLYVDPDDPRHRVVTPEDTRAIALNGDARMREQSMKIGVLESYVRTLSAQAGVGPGEIGGRSGNRRRGGHHASLELAVTWPHVATSSSHRSTDEMGRPRTRLTDCTSTRNLARSSMASWPVFISGTMTRR